jgi:hypothetical protein
LNLHHQKRIRDAAAVMLAAALMLPLGAHGQAPDAPPAPPTTPGITPAPGVQLKLETGEQLSDPEKIEHARRHLDSMRNALSEVLKKLDEARASKDVIKLNCVNEKITQVKGLLKISENSNIALEEAVARKESETAEHEYQKIAIARQKIDQLRSESEECVGEIVIGLEEEGTIVEVEEPSDITSVDPTVSLPPAPVVSRPAAASPL